MEETAFIRKARSSHPTSAPPDKTSDFSRQLVYLKFKKRQKSFQNNAAFRSYQWFSWRLLLLLARRVKWLEKKLLQCPLANCLCLGWKAVKTFALKKFKNICSCRQLLSMFRQAFLDIAWLRRSKQVKPRSSRGGTHSNEIHLKTLKNVEIYCNKRPKRASPLLIKVEWQNLS